MAVQQKNKIGFFELRKLRARTARRRGSYYRIQIRPRQLFSVFRTQDIAEHGHLGRLAGRWRDGNWYTIAWLIQKGDAHLNNRGNLVIDNPRAASIRKHIRGCIVRVEGNVFRAERRRRMSIEHMQITPPRMKTYSLPMESTRW